MDTRKRIIACLKAMEGIENPEEFMELVRNLELDAYQKMKAERDELLKIIDDFQFSINQLKSS
jgi:hypothetical protein